MQDLRTFLIYWNNTFPFDKLYRKKYNIGFGSKEHRNINQIDIYFDILEDRLFDEYYKNKEEENKLKEDYKKGLLFNENVKDVSEEVFNNLFDSINLNEEDKNG